MGEDRRAFSTFSVERSREICHATSLVFWAISSFLFGYVAAVMAASRDHPFLNELMCGNPSAEPTVGNKEWVGNHSWALCGDWRCHRRDSPQPFHEGCGGVHCAFTFRNQRATASSTGSAERQPVACRVDRAGFQGPKTMPWCFIDTSQTTASPHSWAHSRNAIYDPFIGCIYQLDCPPRPCYHGYLGITSCKDPR